MTEPIDKLNSEVKQFLEVYCILNPAGKAAFIAQMGPFLKNLDPQTKKLYESLLESAKDLLSPDEAIERLNKMSVQNSKTDESGQNQDKP